MENKIPALYLLKSYFITSHESSMIHEKLKDKIFNQSHSFLNEINKMPLFMIKMYENNAAILPELLPTRNGMPYAPTKPSIAISCLVSRNDTHTVKMVKATIKEKAKGREIRA